MHGAINMLGLAKRLKARILQASTQRGRTATRACIRSPRSTGATSTPSASRSCYDEGKRCAETLFFDYRRQHRLDIKVMRIFNTYGPRMHPNDGRVVSNFIVQALRGRRHHRVRRRRRQTRSFCYVDDLIRACMMLMDSAAGVTGPVQLRQSQRVHDAGARRESAEQESAAARKIVFKPLPSDDPRQRQPDITNAQAQQFGWEPQRAAR